MNWIYDREEVHVNNVKAGSNDLYDLERGTLGIYTLSRWKNNIEELDAFLKAMGHTIEHPSLIDVTVLGPDIIRASNPEEPIKIHINSNNTYYSEYTTSASNPVWYYIKTLNIFIDEAGIRNSISSDIPMTTDFLTWEQLNTLEYASNQAFQTLLTNIDSSKLIHSGKLISGGYII